ncbi:hypothetical protein H1Q63_07210 [Desmonostoc muscorum CCALA 125]|nr:hypothetical protein [Desmonostoc muscorum CCALA 125]
MSYKYDFDRICPIAPRLDLEASRILHCWVILHIQGACTALEDAFLVAKCLKQLFNPTLAFQEYQLERFHRTKAIVEQSLQAGKMGQLHHPCGAALRNTFIKLMGATIISSFKSLNAEKA